jgi:hypothetical protein
MEEWRAFIAARAALFQGCRWAVVRRRGQTGRGNMRAVVALLDAAARDAVSSGVRLQHFTDMLDAHLWVKQSASPPHA